MSTIRDRDDLRERAIERLDARRGFFTNLTAYVLVNTVLIAIWFVTADGGLFWPIFPLLGWGIGLILHGVETFRRPWTEDRIRREMDRLSDG